MSRKRVPVWPILLAAAYLAFLIWGSIQHRQRQEAQKQEILDRYFPALAKPVDK